MWLNAIDWENEVSPREMIGVSENSIFRFLAVKLYEVIKNVQFKLNTDIKKLIKS